MLFPNENGNTLVWSVPRGGRSIAAALNPHLMCVGAPGLELGTFLLLIESFGAPFFLIPAWDLVSGERQRPCKVFPLNGSWGFMCPNIRLEMQPCEYSQKASLHYHLKPKDQMRGGLENATLEVG